jgi:hypothetical protein
MSGHITIYGNEMADLAAKRAADQSDDQTYQFSASYSYLKRQIKLMCLNKWKNIYTKSSKGQIYQNLQTEPTWKSFNSMLQLPSIVWSSYIQLKLGHGYFKSYLKRIPAFNNCYGSSRLGA